MLQLKGIYLTETWPCLEESNNNNNKFKKNKINWGKESGSKGSTFF